MRKLFSTLVVIAALGACAPATAPAPDTTADEAAIHTTHEAYVEAINTNNVDNVMTFLTDDVVFMAPNGPPVTGADAVRPWIEGYVAAYRTNWTKTTVDLVVSGDYAIEHYAYQVTDTPIAGGAALTDSGKGVNIWRRQEDGSWRVARDIWNTDQALPQ